MEQGELLFGVQGLKKCSGGNHSMGSHPDANVTWEGQEFPLFSRAPAHTARA